MIAQLLELLDDGRALRVTDLPFRVEARDLKALEKRGIEVRKIRTVLSHRAEKWVGTKDSIWPVHIKSGAERVLDELPGRPAPIARKLRIAYTTVYAYLKRLESEGKVIRGSKQWQRKA